jgi:hypothetical protein
MIYLDFIKNKEKNYSNFLSQIDKDKVISIPPKYTQTNLSDFTIYSGYSKNDYDLFYNNLWEKIQSWIGVNFPEFGEKSIKFCSYHLASHFAQNYLSTYNIILNMIKSHNSEFTIICSTEMLIIDSDWCSSLVSLLATVEALDSEHIKYFIIETSSGVASTLISEGSFKYAPSILENSCPDGCDSIFIEKLNKSHYISYQLSNRFNPYLYLQSNINIIPKSNLNRDNFIGAYYQFSKTAPPFFKYTPWNIYTITLQTFSNKIECNFFDSLGRYLFPKLKHSLFNLNTLLNLKDEKILVLEEIVDLESLPLVSIFEKSSNYIEITQHSSNPNPAPLFFKNKKSLATKVFVNNKYSFDFYKEKLPFIDLTMNPLAQNSLSLDPKFVYKKTITVIENDFFRSFGVAFNISKIYLELKLFIQKLIDLRCEFDILWRQRTNEYSPLYDKLSKDYPNLIFQFDSTLTIDEISKTSNISIGFGSNSSLAAQLIKKGVVNYFGSFSYSEFEYVPKIKSYHEFIGPEKSAIHINHLIMNTDNLYINTLAKQSSIIDSV